MCCRCKISWAPSGELLNIWNKRERELEETGQTLKLCKVLHSRPLANLPLTKGCLLGKVEDGTPDWERIAQEAARTFPGRENGGNCDIKNLGDGEVSYCGAIEMSGFLELKCEIIRDGMKEYLTPMGPTPLHVNPIFETGPVEQRFSECIAYKRAVLNAIDYLSRFGYTKEQVYLLLSCCPCEGRISGITNSPNAVATLAMPVSIFDQDIRPKANKARIGPRLVRNPDIPQCTYDGKLPTTKNLSATALPSSKPLS
ncbi:formamidase-like isoform X2 [Olea europaea subsp. europaea]|uniref:Formamidase-like isoform X2 n=1 Tax=Olea europaea subsp. europaea TaxID=158383 RepID=A0A8S0VNV0_OLEEU|nr:formamidase-like isoform X2 [Olea europaea subsp. europaea]